MEEKRTAKIEIDDCADCKHIEYSVGSGSFVCAMMNEKFLSQMALYGDGHVDTIPIPDWCPFFVKKKSIRFTNKDRVVEVENVTIFETETTDDMTKVLFAFNAVKRLSVAPEQPENSSDPAPPHTDS